MRHTIVVSRRGNRAKIIYENGSSQAKPLQIRPGRYSVLVSEIRDDSTLVISDMRNLDNSQGGRPELLNEGDKKKANKLFKDKRITVKEIAEALDISVATLYRYFPGGRKRYK